MYNNDINRYKESAQKTAKEIDSTRIHYTYDKSEFDAPDTMGNIPATLLYIFAMIGGSIFYDRVLIWAMVSVLYFCHIFRHKIKRR